MERPTISTSVPGSPLFPASVLSSPELAPLSASSSTGSPLLAASSSSRSGLDTPPPFQLDEEPAFGLTLLDLLVSLEANVDLIARNTRAKAGEAVRRSRKGEGKAKGLRLDLAGRMPIPLKGEFKLGAAEKELAKFRARMKERVKRLQTRWDDAKVVGLREKISFFTGVENLLVTALLMGFAPEYLHVAYTAMCLYFFPLRWYRYKRASWHYFLFDLCYYTNILVLLFIWVFPGSPILLEVCFGLTHGPLATAVFTWRNSLVFHSVDKVTSLFIHIYPPVLMGAIVHLYPNPAERFPALKNNPHLETKRFLLLNTAIYLVWQLAYWQFIIRARREKIEKQGRVTSFTYMLNDKKGAIGRALQHFPPAYREAVFMFGQLLYTLVTVAPALWYFRSWLADAIFLWCIFAIAVWNGATYYLEVFGKRFEKELTAVRREFDTLSREMAAEGVLPLPMTPGLATAPAVERKDPMEEQAAANEAEAEKAAGPTVEDEVREHKDEL